MNVKVKVAKSFKRQAKPLLKKCPSLLIELEELNSELSQNPRMGDPLGLDSYKIRLGVKSKGKGKRGGMRVISHVETELIGVINIEQDRTTVFLISIYDKSETETISIKELKSLISQIHDR